MLFPLIGLILGLILLVNVGLLYQKNSIYSQFPELTRRRKNLAFLLGILCLFLGLSLGIVGYWDLIAGSSLKILRIDLGIIGLVLLLLSFRQELSRWAAGIGRYPLLVKVRTFWQKRQTFWGVALLFGLIALALMAPMASSRVIFSLNDHTSHIGYIVQAKLALEEGQFPIRIAPLENEGLRYAGFQFYSQLPYTLGGLIYKFLSPGNPYDAYKIMLGLALWTGGYFIYRLARLFTRSAIAAFLAGVAYMSAPYFLMNIHARGAFTEAIAQGILPIVLFFVFKLYQQPKRGHLILTALSWFALAVTHIITFIYSTIFIGILGTIIVLRSNQSFLATLLPQAIAYIWSWLLALYFLGPVVLGSSALSIRHQIDAINPFFSRGLTPIANLLSPTSMPSEPSEFGIAPTYGLHPAVGWILLASWGTVLYYSFSQQNLSPRLQRAKPVILALLSTFFIALFLTWSPVNIWGILPKQLWVTQFTFRFLTHIMWTGSLLTAFAILLIFPEKLDRRHLVLGILVIVMVSRPWLPIPRGTVTVEELLKEPLFKYSGALDYLYRTPPQTLYGNTELHLLANNWIPGYAEWDIYLNKPLNLGAEIYYPKWQPQEKPILSLVGEVPLENIQDKANLLVQVDGKTLATIPLTQRNLLAKVPLGSVQSLSNNNETFGLKFLVEGATRDNKPLLIRMKNLRFEGLSPANTLTSVDRSKEKCHQKGSITHCDIIVEDNTGGIQLPILYYPKMQRVWVDNRRVEVFPVYDREFSLVGLKLAPGRYQVQVQFVGFTWANWISLLSWLSIFAIAILEKLSSPHPQRTYPAIPNNISRLP